MKIGFRILLGFATTFASCCLFATNAFAGGYTQHLGVGISESNFQYGFIKANVLLQSCVTQPVCGLTSTEIQLASKLVAVQAQKIIFVSNADFERTTARVQFRDFLKAPDASVVVVNQEKLYPNEEPLTVLHALGALIMMEAQAMTDEASAHAFTNKILLSAGFVGDTLNLKTNGFIDRGLNFSRVRNEALITFQDDVSAKPLTAQLEKSLPCPSSTAVAILGIVEGLTWGEVKTLSTKQVGLTAVSRVHYSCAEGAGVRNYAANVEAVFTLNLITGSTLDFTNGDARVHFEMISAQFGAAPLGEEALPMRPASLPR